MKRKKKLEMSFWRSIPYFLFSTHKLLNHKDATVQKKPINSGIMICSIDCRATAAQTQ